jgi:peptidoglycan/xylan/chitin deacetylase (PgdA/CDA1 family)
MVRFFKTPGFFRWIFPRRTWGFSRSIPAVYVTFDDGPTPTSTPWILDLLAKREVKATFFCVGNNVLKYPELVQRIRDEGHTIGNHTMNHEKGTATNWKCYRESIDETERVTATGLFRPPYGRIRAWQSHRLSKTYQVIMWSWLSYDFDRRVSVETILEKAAKEIEAGDILVLHDNDKVVDRIKELLPALLDVLEAKKLTLKRIPERFTRPL